ncbi:MAG: hypothetical protein ACE5JC_10785 [Candidatus Zixiibacteriota bacterium]
MPLRITKAIALTMPKQPSDRLSRLEWPGDSMAGFAAYQGGGYGWTMDP